MTSEPISAIVNPLAFLQVDEPWVGVLKEDVSTDHVLNFLCAPGVSAELSDLVERYKSVSVESPRLFVAPAEAQLLERMIWPLRYAKGSYMLGNYLGAISLCGMVAEMAAILQFELGSVTINQTALGETEQKSLFGATFEKLGQARRVQVLAAYNLIDASTRQAYDNIRVKRRRYLHLWSEGHGKLEVDAVDCFSAAVTIVVATLGLGVDEGRLLLKKEVLEYLARHAMSKGDIPGEKG